MKSIFLKIASVVILLFVWGCGRGFYYSNDVPANGTPVFTIDENTQIFARKLYAKESEYKGRELSSSNENADGKSFLTEVQYFILSNNRVLYISTVPSRYIYDKTDSYLIHNSSGKNSYPNSFYFNNFYFGNYNEAESVFEFKNDKIAQDWKIERTSDSILKLVYINDYTFKKVRFKGETTNTKNYAGTEVVDQSVQHSIAFEKIKYFKFLSFKTPDQRNDYDKSGTQRIAKAKTYSKANELYIVFKEGATQKIKYLFIPFDTELIPGYKTLKFGSGKVRYY